MSALAAVILVLSAPIVDVVVAPDQPAPHVYVDDPLILALSVSEDTRARVRVLVMGDGKEATADLGELDLKAASPNWQTLSDLPNGRAVYQILIGFEIGEEKQIVERSFIRIDRPGNGPATNTAAPPVGVNLEQFADVMQLAVLAIPLDIIRLNAFSKTDLDSEIESAHKNAVRVAVAFEDHLLTGAEGLAESLAAEHGDVVARWDIAPGLTPDALEEVVLALRQNGSRARVGLVARDPNALGLYLAGGAGRHASIIIYQHDAPSRADIGRFRDMAERLGYEGAPLFVVGRGLTATSEETVAGSDGSRLVRQVILNLAAGVTETDIDGALIYSDGIFHEGMLYLSGLAHQLGGAQYVGELPMKHPAYAQVFRKGNSWVMAAWNAEETRRQTIACAGVENLALVDARNNPLEIAPTGSDDFELALGPEPVYWSGTGGTILRDAAAEAARREIQNFMQHDEFKTSMPEQVVALVTQLSKSNPPRPDRVGLFALLRAFPDLERLWHEGALSRSVAVPAMASLSRLMRKLCVLEQEMGEEFIEPLQQTLAQCRHFQSKYLTGSTGASGATERGDWLMEEVGRLMEEAETLALEGRPIEAAGIANLAQWRARGLEFAAKAAPLSKPGDDDQSSSILLELKLPDARLAAP